MYVLYDRFTDTQQLSMYFKFRHPSVYLTYIWYFLKNFTLHLCSYLSIWPPKGVSDQIVIGTLVSIVHNEALASLSSYFRSNLQVKPYGSYSVEGINNHRQKSNFSTCLGTISNKTTKLLAYIYKWLLWLPWLWSFHNFYFEACYVNLSSSIPCFVPSTYCISTYICITTHLLYHRNLINLLLLKMKGRKISRYTVTSYT